MKKYASNHGKKILAVALAVAMTLTMGGINYEALAGDTSGHTIESGGYIGEVISNTATSNQQVTGLQFKFVRTKGVSYSYTAEVWEYPSENLSAATTPQAGVQRATINGTIGSDTYDGGDEAQHEWTESVTVGNGNVSGSGYGKPIVLTPNETLGVAITITDTTNHNTIEYYESSSGNGFKKVNGNWVKAGDIVLVKTDAYDNVDDLDSLTINPSKHVFTLGDTTETTVPLNISYSPAYKRDASIISKNENVIGITGTSAYSKNTVSGKSEVIASYGTKSASQWFYVLQNTLEYTSVGYDGTEKRPTVTVKCGDDTLTPTTDGTNNDYKLTYSDNTNPGTAHVTITGLGNYLGYSKTYDFEITKGVITQAMVDAATFVVDTSNNEVTDAVMGNLTLGEDFTATAEQTGSTLTSVTYNITVQGKGNYKTDSVTRTGYEQTTGKIDINAVITAELDDDEYYYADRDIKPSAKSNKSESNTEKIIFNQKSDGAEVIFKDNVNISYSRESHDNYRDADEDEPIVITITGKGSYTGTIELEYSILPVDMDDTDYITVTLENGDTYLHTGSPIDQDDLGLTVSFKPEGSSTSQTLDLHDDYSLEWSGNTNIGTGTVYINGEGNFTGQTYKTFKIVGNFVDDAEVNISGSKTYASMDFVVPSTFSVNYDGTVHKPTIKSIKLGKTKLTEGKDYKVTYDGEKNINAGYGEIKVTPLGQYASQDGYTVKYVINPKKLTGSVNVNQATHIYNGNYIYLDSGEFSVSDSGTVLELGKDYLVTNDTASYTNNINAGTAGITARGTGNYTGSIYGTFTIDPLSLNSDGITVDAISPVTYNGSPQKPEVTVRRNNTPIGTNNYDVTYDNNTNVGQATVTITGKNNYTGTKLTAFTISPKSLEGITYVVGGKPVTGSGTEYTAEYSATYTGIEITPSLSVYDGGVILGPNDYSARYFSNINAGEAYIEITGKGAYLGSNVTIKYTINKKSLEGVTITQNGTQKRTDPDGVVRTYPILKVVDPTASYGKTELKENYDYELSVPAGASQPGPAYVATISAKDTGNYTGSTTWTYEAGSNLANGGEIVLYYPDTTTALTNNRIEYVGQYHPDCKVIRDHADVDPSNYEITGYEVVSGTGTEYDAGSTVEVTITGKNDYYGTIKARYTIDPKNINTLAGPTDANTAQKDSDFVYTYDTRAKNVLIGMKQTVSASKVFNLTQDTDFEVSSSTIGPDVSLDANGNVIPIPITIEGIGNYTGSRTVDYTINQFDLDSTDVTVSDPGEQTYTGEPVIPDPAPTVTRTLKDGTTIPIDIREGYDMTYENNTEVSTSSSKAVVVVKGKKNYKGENRSRTFTISKRKINSENTEVIVTGRYIYDGNPKTPSVTVLYNHSILDKENYDVVPINNRIIGKGDITTGVGPLVKVIGKGAYEGEVLGAFTIMGDLTDENIFTVAWDKDTYDIEDGTITVSKPVIKYQNPESTSGGMITVDPSNYSLKLPTTIVPGPGTLSVVGDEMSKTINMRGNLFNAIIDNVDAIYDYTGDDIDFNPIVRYGTTVLKENVDYTLTWVPETTSLTDVGKKTFRIDAVEGNKYYFGTNSDEFEILYNLNEAEIEGMDPTYPYDAGNRVGPTEASFSGDNPDVKVYVNNKQLKYGVDFGIELGDNNSAATPGYVHLTPKNGKSRGIDRTEYFTIGAVALTDTTCSIEYQGEVPPFDLVYNAKTQKVVPDSVKYNGTTILTANDYSITYPSDDYINVGTKIIRITGRGNYKGSVDFEYEITPANIKDVDYSSTWKAEYAGGERVRPAYVLRLNGTQLVEGTDYEVDSSNDRQVGEYANITFTGLDNFEGSEYSRTYEITKADLRKGKVKITEESKSAVYTGSKIEPDLVVTIPTGVGDNEYTLKKNQDYEVSFSGGMTDVGTYDIVVSGLGNFENSLIDVFTITKKPLNDSTITITPEEGAGCDYEDGKPVEPPVTIVDNRGTILDTSDDYTLDEGTDYVVGYSNNTEATTAALITIEGIGNYGETVLRTFKIGKELDGDITLDEYSYRYDGQIHKPNVKVKVDGTILRENIDYTLQYVNEDGTELDANAGTKKVVVSGINGYYGTAQDKEYEITRRVPDTGSIKIVPKDTLVKDESGNYYATYTGADIEPNVEVYDTSLSTTIPMSTDDYKVTYKRNKDQTASSNPALIIVTLQNNYAMGKEEYVLPFYIKAKEITDSFKAYLVEGPLGGIQYAYDNGNEVKPEVVVKPINAEVTDDDLKPGDDYTLTYSDNINAGAANVTVTGIGNFSGEIDLPFNVVADLSTATVTAPDQFYTGEPVYAPLTVVCGGNTLEEGIDYNVTYTSDDNWTATGTANITTNSDYYSGSTTKAYNIIFAPELLTVTSDTEGYPNFTYTGKSIKPNFIVTTPNGTELEIDKSKITYYNNLDRCRNSNNTCNNR